MSTRGEQYTAVYATEFPAQALLRLRPELRERPCVVMEGEPPLQQVCSLNRRARALGVAHGMTQVEVDTFSGVTVLRRSHSEESTAKAALLECAGGFSPRVEDRSQNGAFLAVIDIAGTKTLFGPPESLAQNLLSRIRALDVAASIAVSENFHAAVAQTTALSADREGHSRRRSGYGAGIAPAGCARSDGRAGGDIFAVGNSHIGNVGRTAGKRTRLRKEKNAGVRPFRSTVAKPCRHRHT